MAGLLIAEELRAFLKMRARVGTAGASVNMEEVGQRKQILLQKLVVGKIQNNLEVIYWNVKVSLFRYQSVFFLSVAVGMKVKEMPLKTNAACTSDKKRRFLGPSPCGPGVLQFPFQLWIKIP